MKPVPAGDPAGRCGVTLDLKKSSLFPSQYSDEVPGDSARFHRDHGLPFEGEDTLFYTGSEGSPGMQSKVVVLLSPASNVDTVSPSDSTSLS